MTGSGTGLGVIYFRREFTSKARLKELRKVSGWWLDVVSFLNKVFILSLFSLFFIVWEYLTSIRAARMSYEVV